MISLPPVVCGYHTRHVLPVFLTSQNSYQVASTVHDLIVKTRPGDAAVP